MHELVQSYVKSYEDNMFDTEEDLYNFINKNLEKFKNDREFLIRLGQKRGLLGYVVKYILNDPENRYLKEIKKAICNLNSSNEVKEDTKVILNLALKLIINPFESEFIPEVEIETKYDFHNWMLEGYSKQLSFYKLKESRKIKLKCRNTYTIQETIKKDKAQKRDDAYHFFRNMNSSLMRRYIDTKDADAQQFPRSYPHRLEVSTSFLD